MSPTKKEIELIYLREAQGASSLIPAGDPIPHERPDFLLSDTLGIEITELCNEVGRREGAKLRQVKPFARRIYQGRSDAVPVSTSYSFAHAAADMPVRILAEGLAKFVYDHRREKGGFDWHEVELPPGYCYIGVFDPTEWEPGGEWRAFVGSDVTLAPRELLAAYIDRKNGLVAEYRKRVPEVWLLLVNDLFLGAGEVHVSAGDAAEWSFDFSFDKVLLFERQPGGTGRVVEIRRQAVTAA